MLNKQNVNFSKQVVLLTSLRKMITSPLSETVKKSNCIYSFSKKNFEIFQVNSDMLDNAYAQKNT